MCTVVLVLLDRLRRPSMLGHLVWIFSPVRKPATSGKAGGLKKVEPLKAVRL
jgi:hypothetical protein